MSPRGGTRYSARDVAPPTRPTGDSDPALLETEGVDRLFALPLKSFVAERKALAQALRRAGQRDAAARVEAIPKPTPSAWVLNQLVLEERPSVDEVLAALESLRQAQLRGGGDGTALRDASRAERDALARLADATRAVLTASGQRVSHEVVDRAQRALRAAAMHPEGRALLLAGRLVTDYEEGGFEALASLAERPIADAPAPAATAGNELGRDDPPALSTEAARRARDAERRALEDAVRVARDKLAEKREAREALEAAAAKARDTLAAAERALEAASEVAADAEARLARASREVEEARAALDEVVRRAAGP